MITIKQGDTRHAIKATLKDVTGNVIDLTNASVQFIMTTRYGSVLIDREALKKDGQVWVVFGPGETDKAGYMDAEFRVQYQDGRVETFPHDGYLKIAILQNKGGLLNASK